MEHDLDNQVVVSPDETAKHLPRRTLNLSKIQTHELKLLEPLTSELAPTDTSRPSALLSYSERLRNSYRANDGGLRDGMLLLGETIKNGQAILVSCSCRSGEMCHADVVKMAIEKVHARLQIRDAAERLPVASATIRENANINPRTQQAINEILSVTKTDLLLSRIDSTEGRSQNEHASFLNQHSQFTRDLYERGATARAGTVIVPRERLSGSQTLNLATNEYAVKKLEQILQDKPTAVELAPKLVEYGKQIAGSTADRETQLKVFNWIYRSLEGKSEFLDAPQVDVKDESKQARFERTIGAIANLAQELEKFEPSDRLVSLDEISRNNDHVPTKTEQESPQYEANISSVGQVLQTEIETAPSVQPEFERIETGNIELALMVWEMDKNERDHWFEVRLPAIDRDLENGTPVSEILKVYQDNIYLASIHEPSSKTAAVTDLRFASSYIDYQLRYPESRFRHFNPRYRKYASMLESAFSRSEVVEAASRIRQENAHVGFEWEKLSMAEKTKTLRPLTSKEMQFLFTEVSPKHYTADMTVARLAHAHSGPSRRMMTDSLMKGEIKPGEEALRLIDGLESRLERPHLKDSISATRHFFESIKTPNEELRYKNSFDHKEIYSTLPPHEKDFVYQRAVQQKEQLEAKFILQQERPTQSGRAETAQPEIERLEKAVAFREVIKSDLRDLLRENPGINGSELNNLTSRILDQRTIGAESLSHATDSSQTATLSRELSEKIESRLRTVGRDEERTESTRTNHDYSPSDNRQYGDSLGQRQPPKDTRPDRSYLR